jgi:hypothetical protein
MHLLKSFHILPLHTSDLGLATQTASEEAIWRLSQQASIRRAAPGATEQTIRSLGVIAFNLDRCSQADTSNPECAICLNAFCNGSKINALPCSHFFHRKCIRPWLRLRGNCPKCRKPVSETPEKFGTSTHPQWRVTKVVKALIAMVKTQCRRTNRRELEKGGTAV